MRQLAVPGYGDANLFLLPDARASLSGLVQKLVLPNENLIVAWAGSLLQARALITELDTAVRQGAATSADALRVIFEQDEHDRDNVSLIGSIIRPRPGGLPGEVSGGHFAYNYDFGDTWETVEVRLAGSGTASMLEILPDLLVESPILQGQDQARSAFSFGLALNGYLSSMQAESPANFSEYWGGAFEAAFLQDGQIRKLDRIVHLRCEVHSSEDGLYFMAISPDLIGQRYVGNDLVVSAFHSRDRNISIHLISPLLNAVRPVDIAPYQAVDFDYDVLSCRISCSGSEDACLHIRTRGADEPRLVGIQREGDRLTFWFDSILGRELIDIANAAWGIVISDPPVA